MNLEAYTKALKALGDEKRIKIIQTLYEQELCACELSEKFDFSQSAMSYQMKLLVDAKLVNAKIDGVWTRYSLNKETFKEIASLLKSISE